MLDKIMAYVKSYAAVKKLCIFFAAFMLTATVMGGNHDIFYGRTDASVSEKACIEQKPDATQQNGIDSVLEFAEQDFAGGTVLAATNTAKLEETKTDSGEDIAKVRSKLEDEEEADDEAHAGESEAAKGTEAKTTEKAVTTEKVTSKVNQTDEEKSDKESNKKKKTADYNGNGYEYCPKIPMSAEIQEYTYNKCLERGLEYELVLAVIWRESRFNPNALNVNTNGTSDSGYMQINDVNRKWLRDNYGITDLMDPYQNIDAGTAILARLTKKYGSHNAMLAYQYGEGGMASMLKRGITTSEAIEKAYKQRDYYRKIV